ncbi:MFS transporter [Sutcliffiella cohnii]
MYNLNFFMFAITRFISIIGSSISYIGIYWVISLSYSEIVVSLLTFTFFLTRFISFTFLGPFADRYRSDKIIINTMVFRFILLLFVGLLFSFFELPTIFVFLVIVLQILPESLSNVSSTKIIPQIVEDKNLTQANSLLNFMNNFSMFLGMVIGGFLISFISLKGLFFLQAICYLIGVLLFKAVKLKGNQQTENRVVKKYIVEWKEGLVYIKENKWLLGLIAMAISANISIAPITFILAPYAINILNGDSLTFTMLENALLIGGLLSSLFLAKFNIKRLSLIYILSCLFQGIVMLVFGLSSGLVVSLICLLFIGIAVTVFNIPFTTLIQRNVEINNMGRIRSVTMAITSVISLISFVLGGIITTYIGIQNTLILFSILGTISTIVVLLHKPFSSLEITNKKVINSNF